MSKALAAYDSLGVPMDFHPLGSDADEADAMISAAAMRYFAQNAGCWSVPAAAEYAALSEGWILVSGWMAARKAQSVSPAMAKLIHQPDILSQERW